MRLRSVTVIMGLRQPTHTRRVSSVEDDSFEHFYLREYAPVLALARVLTGGRDAAEDVTHEAFAAALVAWDDLDNPARWIRSVVANKARSAWRRHYAERRAVRTLAGSVQIGHDVPVETEDFWAEVRRLPRRQAQAVSLFYLEDRPVAEIASILGCDESTVRVHLMRGRRALARRLGVSDG